MPNKEVIVKACEATMMRLDEIGDDISIDCELRIKIRKIIRDLKAKLNEKTPRVRKGTEDGKEKEKRKGLNSYNNFLRIKVQDLKKDDSNLPSEYQQKATRIWNKMSPDEKKKYRIENIDGSIPATENIESDDG